MDAIRILGGVPLTGEIVIGGAKNAALPLMAATLLTDQPLTLINMPELVDITTMSNLLRQHGARIDQSALAPGSKEAGPTGRSMTLTTDIVTSVTAPYDLVRRMRAGFFVLGPLLARTGEAKVSLPGGCAIGTRGVDLHLKALETLGAKITVKEGYVYASVAGGRFKGANVTFPKVTVGGTENLLMAAVLADGDTVLENAAREPEIGNLAECLNAMGAEVTGIGSGTLRIKGKKSLHGARVAVIPDRIETGTYASAAAITRGRIVLKGTRFELLEAVFDAMRRAGVSVDSAADGIVVSCWPSRGIWFGGRPADRHRYGHRTLSRFPHGLAGPVDGAHGHGQRRRHDHRDHFREPLHACAGAAALRRRRQRARRVRHCARTLQALRRAGHGDGSARFVVADPRRISGQRRNPGEPHLPSGPGLRAP